MALPVKAIIVDDEPLARTIIRAYLNKWPLIEVVAECSNGFEAMKAIREYQPQVMFLDVQMPKITGLELMEVIDFPVYVIFTTAYDQYAIKAFELNAVDYLLKPFSEDRFALSVKKVIEKINSGVSCKMDAVEKVQEESPAYLERVVVKKGDKLEVLSLDKIMYFEAQEDYVMVYTHDSRYLKQKTMKYFEDHLSASNFVRIHRSYIVNIEKIERLEPYDKDTYLAILNNSVRLKISRTGYKKLREQMNF